MLSRRTRPLIGGASALGIGVLVALPAALPAAATSGPPAIRPGRVISYTPTHSSRALFGMRAAAASLSFTHYTATVKAGTKSYTYTIAGKNPAVKQSSPASTIKVKLIPTIMKFGGHTWDPAKTDSCDTGASPLSRTQKSPLFVSRSWTWGGTKIGTGQVTDAFQRAEFWKYTKPSGINPGYHVKLSMTTLAPITINVPNADAATGSTNCGNHLLGAANINWLDPHLQSVVLPSLRSKGVGPSTLPIFLLHNFVEYEGNTNNCCILGYHSAYGSQPLQTYALATYDNSRQFSGSRNISALSHEVAEWQDDPAAVNPTPTWGHIGQVTGCQANLEVGDPLSGTTFAVKSGTFTYRPQELAFFSWFYHQKPSLGVNGWYSDQGTFRSYAKACS